MPAFNNPMNVTRGAAEWKGELPGEGRFPSFDTMVDGVRAGMLCLIAAVRRHSCETVYDIVAHYAPPSDHNPTRAYARFVANRLGLRGGIPGDPHPGDCVEVTRPEVLERMAAAMAWWETHTVLSADILKDAATAALGLIGL